MTDASSDIGLIGLAVMGQNLALNIADHSFNISVFIKCFDVDILAKLTNHTLVVPHRLFGKNA